MTWNSGNLVKGIIDRLPKDTFDEVIVTDDGSTDNTVTVVEGLGLKCFTHEHTGYGGNIKYGLQKAIELGGEYMAEIHGDGQYDPSYIPRAFEMLEGGADFVQGSRFVDLRQPLRDKMPLIRYVANIGLSFFARLVLRVPLTEFHSGFRMYSRKMVEITDPTYTSNDHLYSFQSIAQTIYCGLKIGELPIRCDYSGEHSSINLRKSVVYALNNFVTLFYFMLAKMGFKTKLFRCRNCTPQ